MRTVSSFVLPLPGGASTTQLPSASSASDWRGFVRSSSSLVRVSSRADPLKRLAYVGGRRWRLFSCGESLRKTSLACLGDDLQKCFRVHGDVLGPQLSVDRFLVDLRDPLAHERLEACATVRWRGVVYVALKGDSADEDADVLRIITGAVQGADERCGPLRSSLAPLGVSICDDNPRSLQGREGPSEGREVRAMHGAHCDSKPVEVEAQRGGKTRDETSSAKPSTSTTRDAKTISLRVASK